MSFPTVSEAAMSDNLQTHERSENYVFRMPTPPRIVIPPLGSWNHSEEDASLGSIISHPDPTINIDFLQGTSYDAPITASNRVMNGWRYENRREAQSILSYLYLGPLHAARDKDFLRREGITLILAIQHKSTLGQKLTTGAMRVADELGIAKFALEAAHNQDLIALFPTATRIINTHLRELHNRAMLNPHGGIPSGKCLIFCESGNEKSAAVAAAYLMDNFQGVDYVRACQVCNARRFCCSFDDNVKNYLKSYDDILSARRSVAAASPFATPSGTSHVVTSPFFGAPTTQYFPVQASADSSTSKSKRGRERDDDDDMDMDDTTMEDHDRFVGREFAPFR